MRFLILFLLVAAAPLRAYDCTGTDLLATMPAAERATLQARADAMPFGHGLLWQARRDDATITLFGTYHLPHPRVEAHLDTVLPLARAADAAYFEMNAPDTKSFERAAATQPGVLFIADGPTLPERLTEAEWQALRSRMAERGFPAFMTAKLRPVFVSMILGMSPCALKQQQAGAHGIDRRLAGTLHSEGRDTRSIEDVMTTMEVFNAFPPDKQIDMLRLSLGLPVDPDDVVETLLTAYLRQEIALIWEYGRDLSLAHGGPTAEADFAALERVLLTDRNRAWAAKLLEEAPGHSVFVAVGAAHLMGETGLLSLLRADGYAITPLPLD